MKRDRCLILVYILLFVMNLELFECRRGGGGNSRRVPTSSPRRTTTYRAAQRVTTPRYNIQPQQANPNYNYNNQPTYNRPGAAQKATTPRYNIQTQSSYPNYNNPNYNQPNYNNPNYNRPGSYNQPHYNSPTHYNQPGNYYPAGNMYPYKKDHSVRNSVLAGLGGSALGLYLGYQLAGLTHGSNSNNNNPNYVGGGGYPQYSVVHHYYHGDRPIPKEAKVEASVIKACENITFCTPNTTPLCMNNGTVYCVASLDSTIICNENSTELKCINSTITLPCDSNSTNCSGTNTTAISIPCVTTVDVFGDFTTNKFSVNKISKRSAENEGSNSTNDTSTTTTTTTLSPPMAIQASPSSVLTSQGFRSKYCVTVIADPIKEPELPPPMTNAQFAKYLETNEATKAQAERNWSGISNSILEYLYF